MNKTAKHILVISIVVTSLGLLIYLFRKDVTKLLVGSAMANGANNSNTSDIEVPPVKTNNYSSIKFDGTKVLKKGSKGDEVWGLQNVLNELLKRKNTYATLLVVDGVFGSATEKALKQITGNTSTTYNNILNYLYGIKE